jgi:hypothetical protein
MKINIDKYITLVNVEITWLQKTFILVFPCLETQAEISVFLSAMLAITLKNMDVVSDCVCSRRDTSFKIILNTVISTSTKALYSTSFIFISKSLHDLYFLIHDHTSE